jgi:chromosome partitioning protein
MHTITFCSFKGGTAKTSTALHLGACLAGQHQKRVLLVDFDAQANLSVGLGIGYDSLQTMAPVLQGHQKIRDVIQPTAMTGLEIVAANAFLDGIERTLTQDPYAHERLRKALQEVSDDYDYCFIDTPPSLGWLTQSAFFAAQHSLICAIPEAYSVLALRRLREFQDGIRQNHPIDVAGVVLSFWDERGAVNQAFLDEINASFPAKLFESKVRRDVSVSRAVLKGQTVFDQSDGKRAAEDYRALTREFLTRMNQKANS